jgi:hypothetical protein
MALLSGAGRSRCASSPVTTTTGRPAVLPFATTLRAGAS